MDMPSGYLSVSWEGTTAGCGIYLTTLSSTQTKDKVRIVFDCAAKYDGVSFNEKVLPGPDLTNSLVGILSRFRLRKVALMADVEAMFHQVSVTPEDRDVLRFLWWPNGDLTSMPAVYRMTAHLFGGTWSPSCCTYALHHIASDNALDFSQSTLDTVCHDFYVDDCLKSSGQCRGGGAAVH